MAWSWSSSVLDGNSADQRPQIVSGDSKTIGQTEHLPENGATEPGVDGGGVSTVLGTHFNQSCGGSTLGLAELDWPNFEERWFSLRGFTLDDQEPVRSRIRSLANEERGDRKNYHTGLRVTEDPRPDGRLRIGCKA